MLLTRRALLKGAGGAIATFIPPALPSPAFGRGGYVPTDEDYFNGTAVDHGVEYRRTNMALIPREYRPQITREIVDPEPGRIVSIAVSTFLYLTRADGTSIRYAVGVGREGFQWFGSAQVMRKGVWPTWTPPVEMIKRNPDISPGPCAAVPAIRWGRARSICTATVVTSSTASMVLSSLGPSARTFRQAASACYPKT